MTRITAIGALALALAGASVATASTAAAAPTYGISVSSGGVNPFSAVNGR
ncbi:MAG: hypothetical protein AAGJ70_02590 [Pseudomonadota bacterium]